MTNSIGVTLAVSYTGRKQPCMGLSEMQQSNWLTSHKLNRTSGSAGTCRPELSGACANVLLCASSRT
jgi:hypothetical protein